LAGLPPETWQSTDAILEVGSEANAQQIFAHLNASGINMFAQKIGWKRVALANDMPTSHRDGSLFLTSKSDMPWSV
jgi:hypothetical protein